VSGGQGRPGCTSLSIEPGQGSIDGVVVSINREQLPALDEREAGYERLGLPSSCFLLPDGIHDTIIYVYRSLEQNRAPANPAHPVLQSYVDCVMAGYQDRFSDVGLYRFLHSTSGWTSSMRNDRCEPAYPRAVMLDEKRYANFDLHLATVR
jgi:hypothetical protein